jgi:hypothetical protein
MSCSNSFFAICGETKRQDRELKLKKKSEHFSARLPLGFTNRPTNKRDGLLSPIIGMCGVIIFTDPYFLSLFAAAAARAWYGR